MVSVSGACHACFRELAISVHAGATPRPADKYSPGDKYYRKTHNMEQIRLYCSCSNGANEFSGEGIRQVNRYAISLS